MKKNKMDGSRIMKGIELSDEYVDLYKKSHTYNMEYKINYREYSMINNIFDKPFSALITFCGTLGYANLLSNAKKITGIDLSQKMIDTAKEINKDKNLNVELIKDNVYTFPSHTNEKYDFIELGSLGSYIPFDIDLIQKYFDILEKGGVILIKSSVISVKDLFEKNSLTFRIFCSFKKFIYEIYYNKLFRKKERVDTTLSEVNERLNSFLKMNENVRVLMRDISKTFETPIHNYSIFLKKEF